MEKDWLHWLNFGELRWLFASGEWVKDLGELQLILALRVALIEELLLI